MDRELLLEIGTEEIPASWLPTLTTQLGQVLAARLQDARLAVEEATAAARASPPPPLEGIDKNVWADGGSAWRN